MANAAALGTTYTPANSETYASTFSKTFQTTLPSPFSTAHQQAVA
jgi:hypothetical protein